MQGRPIRTHDYLFRSLAKKLFLFAILVIVSGCRRESHKADTEFRVATWNVLWLFDDDLSDVHEDESMPSRMWSAPSQVEYHWKLENVARAIRDLNPDIIALQEIENEKVLEDLVAFLKREEEVYHASFREGRDTFTQQDVGLLSRWEPDSVSLLDDDASFRYDLTPTKHLVAHYTLPDGMPLTVIALHLPARNAERRKEMARSVSRFIRLGSDKSPVVILGDLNTLITYDQRNFPEETEIGTLMGRYTGDATDDLVDIHSYFGIRESTHRSRGSQFDRILVDTRFVSGNLPWQLVGGDVLPELAIVGRKDGGDWNDGYYWKIPQRQRDISDHYPVLATFTRQTRAED